MDPEKVIVVQDWPVPWSIKALKGFLGLTGYYIRFIKDYGKIARPLTDLFTKRKFAWSSQSTEAMNILKTALTTASILALLDFSQQFHVECDAAGQGYWGYFISKQQAYRLFQ